MKVNVNNIEKINAALVKVQTARMKARTISAEDIREEALECEKRLSKVMFNLDKKGVKYVIDLNAQQFPSAYQGIPESTKFTLERGTKDWFVVGIARSRCKGSRKNELRLTAGHESAVIKFVSETF